MKLHNIWWLCLVMALFQSCDKNRVFEEFYNVQGNGWHQDSLATFIFEVPDEHTTYNLSVDIRNTTNYKFCNLYYRYYLYDTKGSKLKTGLVEVFLMDAKTGKPLGSGIGGTYTHNFDFLKGYTFPSKGKYKIKFKQYMREVSLEEIKNVGFRLEKSPK